MSDILIVHPFENMIINVFGMHFDFIILHVSTIMEVPLLGLEIGPCLKCRAWLRVLADLASFSASIFLFLCKILGSKRFFRSCMIAGEVWVRGTRGWALSVLSVIVSVIARCNKTEESFEKFMEMSDR